LYTFFDTLFLIFEADKRLYCFSAELAAEACTNHEYLGLEGSKVGREVGE
jgi:hypothetical protein